MNVIFYGMSSNKFSACLDANLKLVLNEKFENI